MTKPELAPLSGERVDDHNGASRWVAWATLGVLLALAIVSYLDRQVIALMVEPIRKDLQITEVQVGLLQGVAFGLFYAIFGLPMGWLVDRWPRRAVICLGLTVWSLSTAACGVAGSFVGLLAARLGVGAGEASLSPAAYSMLADLFPKRRLAFALGIFGAGSTLGSAVAMAAGGALLAKLGDLGTITLPLLGARTPWQLMFLLIGLPGLLFAFVVFAVPEPARRVHAPQAAGGADGFGRFVLERRRYLTCHFVGFGLIAMLAYGTAAWAPVMLQRRFGLDVAAVGAIVGAVTALAGGPGFLFSGWAADRWFAAGRRNAHLLYYVISSVVGAGAALMAFQVVHALWLVVPLFAITQFTQPFTGPAAAHLQLVTPSEYRGRISAAFLLVFNLMGLCLGPTTVALITQYVFHDPARVSSALALFYVVIALAAAGVFALGLGPARKAVEIAESW